jgi:hypothetical protein
VRKMQRRIITMEGGKVIDDGSHFQRPVSPPLSKLDAGTAGTAVEEREP